MSLQQFLFICVIYASGVLAAYDPYSYQPAKYQLIQYPSYGKYESPKTYSSSQYNYSPYGYSKVDDGNDGYGYQTRTTFVDNNKYHIPKPDYSAYGVSSGRSGGAYNLARRSFYKQAQTPGSYLTAPYTYQQKDSYGAKNPSYGSSNPSYSYGSKPMTYQTKPNAYAVPEYDSYDPCHSLPEGDYALQGEFTAVFAGIDAQCNFVKCANYKSYVNPCSIGTKNDDYGGPDAKKGFCADIDYQHYCGHIPPSPPEPYEYDIYK